MEENHNSKQFWRGALAGALTMFLVGALVLFGTRLGEKAGGSSESEKTKVTAENDRKLESLKKLIDAEFLYADDIEEGTMQEGLYKGYIEALGDPYSVYYDEEETQKLMESTQGEYSGIGVVMSQNIETKTITVVQVYSNSPAKEAGLEENDILYMVNGEKVAGRDLSDVVQDVRGEEGTKVALTVLRGESAKEVTLEVERRKIEVDTVVSEMKDGQIGYIRIAEFDSVTYAQFEKAFEDLEAQGMKGLVVDLRANPGGNVDTVCKILDRILPEGTIVSTRDRDGEEMVMESDAEHQFTKPIAVLADGNSASASEIFAGAIQDYGLGPVVGATTYGKGIVQTVYDLKDGTSLKLTTSEYFTPKGRNIHGKGIEPDVEVEYVRDEKNPSADNQLDAALKAVQDKI